MSIVHQQLNHFLRIPLAAEVHSRPSLRLMGPEALTHLAVYCSDGQGGFQHSLLSGLCQHFGVAGPHLDAKYFFHDFGTFRLQWEAHTEFATYTFAEQRIAPAPLEECFEHMPLRFIPAHWLQGLNGTLMAATHVVLQQGEAELGALRRLFANNL